MKRITITAGVALGALPLVASAQSPFERVSTFHCFLNTSVDDETSAEIVAASEDGMTLIYTDSATESIGFVDITDPAAPLPGGSLALPGEPTAVAARGQYALVGVNTSLNFIQTSGELVVVDIATRTVVRSIPLGGQPDSVAVSPDGRYAAVAIENERDEELGNGAPPQLPAGFLVIVDLIGNDPNAWQTRQVDLTGVATLFPEDPEPEYVDINRFNIAAVTLQENNHVVLVSLQLGTVLTSFSAGTVDLTEIDTEEEGLILQNSSLNAVPREPDAITWVGDFALATADEGDLDGGSRGFTNWSIFGQTFYEAGNTLEHAVARIGHYPEERSGNKGNEPESVEYALYSDNTRYLFVGSERSSVVFVYALPGNGFFGITQPQLVQILPTGVAPEGLLALPERDLLVVSCEADERDAAIRGSVMIYARTGNGNYPSIRSVDRTGTSVPIPWAALSGLAVDRANDQVLYTVHDSFYRESRMYRIDTSSTPAVITGEFPLVDANGRLMDALTRVQVALPNATDFDPSSIVNVDGTVNLDLEGIATSADPNIFWAVSEGTGNLQGGVSNPNSRPFERPNLLLRLERNPVAQTLDIVAVVGVPFPLTSEQLRFGLEGVAETPDGIVYVAFQRAWQGTGDPADRARIGRFDPATRLWSFAHYPLDPVESPNGGWVGLSDLAPLADGRIAVLERDNAGGPDARVKRIYTIDPASVSFVPAAATTLPTLTKTLRSDLLLDGLFASTGGVVFEKLEGLAVLSNGDAVIVNDNDGVDDNSGETRLLVSPALFQ